MPSNSPGELSPDYITVETAAQLAGVSKNTVWNLIKDGKLPAYRIGSRIVRIKWADIQALFTPYTGGEFGQWR
jgi:excisionase family DNA binding protein